MSRGILLLAHGAPDTLEDLGPFLTHIRGGRAPSAEVVAETRRRYESFGGRSPLTEITMAQASSLADALAGQWPVLVGMRHAPPFIADVLAGAAAQGLDELVAVPLAPQYSTLSVGRYRRSVEEALPAGTRVSFVEPWFEHPLLLDAFAERVRAALARGPRDAVVFTAHSLPVSIVREGDPYPDQVRATAAGVAARLGLDELRLAYQSAVPSGEPWLGPPIEETLAVLAGEGRRRVLAVPIGFVSDHAEILYDIDVAARGVARDRGVDLMRSESLNTSPTFIRMLAGLVRAHG